VLIVIAVTLSAFLFPGIVAVRRHGWFDNVVDTIEAVGTKPHLLVASVVLTYILVRVAFGVGIGAIDGLSNISDHLPTFTTGNQVQQVEKVGSTRRIEWLHPLEVTALRVLDPDRRGGSNSIEHLIERDEINSYPDFIMWGPGLIIGIWQTLIVALLAGYCLNLALSGGMLTYLWVREDDYWDDEDLQDLDQLAKELEEEAKREDARGPTQATVVE
jgi:hypothetical protein